MKSGQKVEEWRCCGSGERRIAAGGGDEGQKRLACRIAAYPVERRVVECGVWLTTRQGRDQDQRGGEDEGRFWLLAVLLIKINSGE